MQSAELSINNLFPVVTVILTDAGADTYTALTANPVGQQIAVIMDGRVISAPMVIESNSTGTFQIFQTTGNPRVEAAPISHKPRWTHRRGRVDLSRHSTLLHCPAH
ncbi:MAG: preprotein translocase subunit SecD [Myxococcota bacterium]